MRQQRLLELPDLNGGHVDQLVHETVTDLDGTDMILVEVMVENSRMRIPPLRRSCSDCVILCRFPLHQRVVRSFSSFRWSF